MKPTWIIENIVKEESFIELAKAVEQAVFPLQRLNSDFSYDLIGQYRDDCVIFNGSIQMAKMVAPYLGKMGNYPVVYCSWENYLCTAYYDKLGDFLFNDNYVMVPYGELKRRKFFFYGLFGREAMIFIRPNDGDKSFKGGLVDLEDFDKIYEPHLSAELALVSSPKNIRGEWRFVVSKYGDIIAYSTYRYQSLITRIPSAPQGAIEKCKEILAVGYYPDSVFCIDIAEDDDGDYYLMELNSFSSAGLYACDKRKIVERVSEIALDEYAKGCRMKV